MTRFSPEGSVSESCLYPSQMCMDSSALHRIGSPVVAVQNLMKERENPSPPTALGILVVDDNDISRITTKWFLSNFGFAVDSARSAEEGLDVFDPASHDLVITDNSMPGMSGAEMAQAIKARSPGTPILMYSGNPPEDCPYLDWVIQRPAHLLEVKETADRLLAKHRVLQP